MAIGVTIPETFLMRADEVIEKELSQRKIWTADSRKGSNWKKSG